MPEKFSIGINIAAQMTGKIIDLSLIKQTSYILFSWLKERTSVMVGSVLRGVTSKNGERDGSVAFKI